MFCQWPNGVHVVQGFWPFLPIDGELIVFNCVAQIHLASRSSIETTFGPRLVAMLDQLR